MSSSWDHFVSGPHFTPDEQLELVRKAQGGDGAARRALIVSNLRFVMSLAHQFAMRARLLHELEDLVSVGVRGLDAAIDPFKAQEGVQFLTYASKAVRTAILDYASKAYSPLSRGGWAKRMIVSGKYRKEMRELRAAGFSKEAGILAIAAKYGRSVEVVGSVEAFLAPPISLSEPMGGDVAFTMEDVVVDDGPLSDSVCERVAWHERVRRAIAVASKSMSARQQRLLEERLLADEEDKKTLQQLGDELGLCRERVRQIEEQVLKKLRDVLVEDERQANLIRTPLAG